MFRLALVPLVALLLAGALGTNARGSMETLPFNGRIAFATIGGIASMNPDGSGQWGVELNVGDAQPAWSPDGSQLVVSTHWAGRAGLLAMQPDGSNAHMLTNDGADSAPAWSPDGEEIAFTSGRDLYEVKPDGSGRTQLTHLTDTAAIAARPTWSPDGTKLAFSESGGGSEQIVVVDLATGRETTLTPASIVARDPAWSPDGTRIAFADGGNIAVMNADGSGITPLTASREDSAPAWSPNGDEIAYAHRWGIWVMNRDGSGQFQLAGGDEDSYPAWQPLQPPPPGLGCTYWGTAGNDLLVGSDGNDVLCGLGGNDTLIGLAGYDFLYGGDGNDYLAGGLGYDQIFGGDGNDTIDARDGSNDLIVGGPGTDSAVIDPRGDTMAGIEQPRVDRNLAVWRPAYADTYEPTNPPVRAVDGLSADWWNSGGYPPHWLEVDLQKISTIGRISLVANDWPAGAQVLVLGRAEMASGFRLLHVFHGPTVYQQELDFTPKHPWQRIRYLRVDVPAESPFGWVSLCEIAAYPPAKQKR